MRWRQLVSKWNTLCVDDCMEAIIDYRGKTPTKTTHGIPLVTAKIIKAGRMEEPNEFIAIDAFDAWMTRGLPLPGDVVLTTEAPLGEVAQLDECKVALAQRVITLRGKSGLLDNTYLKYVLQGDYVRSQLLGRASGSTVSGIKQSELRKVEIPIPPFAQQQNIARILGSLDDKIALNREMNKTLEAMAQAIFKSWFVDFEPFKEGEFVESELGMIPKGWEVKSLGDICSFIKGCSYKGNGLSEDDGAYMFNLGCFNAPRVHATEKIKRYVGEYRERHSVKQGDIILANTDMTQERAILGRPLIIPEGYEPGFISHHVYKVELSHNIRQDIVPFLFFSFLEDRFREKMVGSATGSVVLALPRDVLEQYNMLIPHDGILDKFLSMVQPLLANIEEHIKQSQTLSTLRGTLLPKLLSGEIEV